MSYIHGLMSKEKFLKIMNLGSINTVLENDFSKDLFPIIYNYVTSYEEGIVFNFFKRKAIRIINKSDLSYANKVKNINEINEIWCEQRLFKYMGWKCRCHWLESHERCCWICDLNDKAWDHKSNLLFGPNFYPGDD